MRTTSIVLIGPLRNIDLLVNLVLCQKLIVFIISLIPGVILVFTMIGDLLEVVGSHFLYLGLSLDLISELKVLLLLYCVCYWWLCELMD